MASEQVDDDDDEVTTIDQVESETLTLYDFKDKRKVEFNTKTGGSPTDSHLECQKPDLFLGYSLQIGKHQILVLSGKKVSNEAQVIDVSAGTVKATNPMLTERCSQAMAKYGSKVYVMGGIDSSQKSIDACEVYDIPSESWRSIAPLPQKRNCASAVAVPNGKIYLFGGVGEDGPFTDTIQAYDRSENQWTVLEAKLPVSHIVSLQYNSI